MEELISFTMLNDFIFCPASIYFHKMYDGVENLLFTGERQITGKALHKKIDDDDWTQSDVVCGRMFECEKYGIYGKIDKYYPKTRSLVESKAKIATIYDGYVFQLYAQCFGCRDAGLVVDKLALYSIKDNKKYPIALPEDDPEMLEKFETLIKAIREFDIESFKQSNVAKCDPRSKQDFLNSTLDLGYTMLFNFVESLLYLFGFDLYVGNLHQEFYMRKSLVCDIVEPFRPLIEQCIRTAVSNRQFKLEDFNENNGQFRLDWNKNKEYILFLLKPLLQNKDGMFKFVRDYYRAFVQQKPVEQFPVFKI